MTDDFQSAVATLRALPPGFALESARQDLERRWASGDPIAVELYLAALPALATDPEHALVLIYAEVLARLARGGTSDVSAYRRRFPEYADRLEPLFEVHEALAGLATGFGPTPVRDPPPLQIPGYHGMTFANRGGMGVVYRATNDAGQTVAVKVVDTDLAADSSRLVRFLQEGDILARLDHPGIVRFVTAGVHARQPYLVTEWIEGGTLAQRTHTPWTVDKAVNLVMRLAEATHFAHERGVIHRDLKPANVVLVGDQPRIIDFGVARLLGCGGTMTGTGEVIGTPGYMAPEQLEGRQREIGTATDVFSLGVILYELLAGVPPFGSGGRLDILQRVLRDEPPPLSALAPHVPARLDAICRACLAKRPRDRIATAQRLPDDLSG